MGWATAAIEKLSRGEWATVAPRGSSMEPLIHSGQVNHIEPVFFGDLAVDDVVLCRVHGCVYLHLVKAVDGGRVLIGNNRGGVNGWTRTVYGRRVKNA